MFHTNDLRNAVYLMTTVPFAVSLFATLFSRRDARMRDRRREFQPVAATSR
jgi:hypothetical protein